MMATRSPPETQVKLNRREDAVYPRLDGKTPVNLYYSLTLDADVACVGYLGGFELWTPVRREPTLKYHLGIIGVLTQVRYPDRGQCFVVR